MRTDGSPSLSATLRACPKLCKVPNPPYPVSCLYGHTYDKA